MPTTTAWLTADNLKDYWRSAPTSTDVLADLVEASIAKCTEHLQSQGLEVPATDAVTGKQRLAQAKFARAIWEAQDASEDDTIGADGYSSSVARIEAQAKRLLGSGVVIG